MTDTVDWLLGGDASVRWQTMQDLLDAPPEEVAIARAQVETTGWGARLLAAREADGSWAGGACFPGSWDWHSTAPGQPWTATMHSLQTLQLLGLDPSTPTARQLVDDVAEHVRWEHEGQRYFDGEVEPCINGRTVGTGAYFGVDVAPLVARLVGERLADGGWNCEAERGSVRSSFDTTINVVEGLLEWELAGQGGPEVTEARRGGEEYLLSRGLFRRLSTGEVARAEYLELAFPWYWHHDVLRALDHFRRVGGPPDPRLAEAAESVRTKQLDDGRWPLERIHPGAVHFDLEAPVGTPSRWNTLRALRVLRWLDAS